MNTRHDQVHLPARTLALVGITVVALFGSLLWSPSGGRARRLAALAAAAPDPATVTPPARPLVAVRAPRPEAKPPTRPKQEPLREAALPSVVGELSALLRAGLQTSDADGALERCAGSNSPSCRQLLSDALQQVISARPQPTPTASAVDVSSVPALGAVITESRDPIERVAALLALQGTPERASARLPAGAYRDLANKPPIEAQLLLERHADLAFDDPALARAAQDLAASATADEGVREAALGALGHPETAVELTSAVRALAGSHDASSPAWQRSVAAAVGHCGFACVDAIDLMAFGATAQPELVGDLMRAMAPEDKRQVRAYFSARVPPEAAVMFNRDLESTLPEG